MPPTPHIRELVRSIVSDSPDERSVRSLIQVGYDLARAYLTVSRRRFLLNDIILVDPDRDLPLDAIAELFERNAAGHFVRLRRSYDALNWESLDDNELWTMTRRMVCGQVSDSLFKFYRMADPSLGRIIRNVKRAVGDSEMLCLQRCTGQLYIVIQGREIQTSSNPTPEMLESWLSQNMTSTQSVTGIAKLIYQFLDSNPERVNAVALSMVAISIRNVTVRLQLPLLDEQDSLAFLDEEELTREVIASVFSVLKEKRHFYVSRSKLSEKELSQLGHAVTIRLHAFFSSSGPDPNSNYEACLRFIPALDKDSYRRNYRNVFEYLFQLSRAELVKRVSTSVSKSALLASGNE